MEFRIFSLSILAVFLLTNASAYPQVIRIVPGSEISGRITASKNDTIVKVSSKTFFVEVKRRSGKIDSYEVLMLRDPGTGLCWHTYAPRAGSSVSIADRLLANSIVYFADSKAVMFSLRAPAFLWVSESRGRCGNMENGQMSVLRILNGRKDEVDLGFVKDYQIIGLELKPDFVFSKLTASPAAQPKLRSVTKSAGKWQLILDGPNGDSAVIVLDDHYKVISTSITPPNKAR